MPELPEVETIRRDLSENLLHKKIIDVLVRLPKIVKNEVIDFTKFLIGQEFTQISRRGKLLIFDINNDLFLTCHLRMTGQLIYQDKTKITAGGHSDPGFDPELFDNKSHVQITFADNSKLFFNDMRQFGYMHIVNKKGLDNVLEPFGIEPLTPEFTLEAFKAMLPKKRNIKAFLLDQHFIVGIGNIYADETLFSSGIHPIRKAGSLTPSEIKKLHQNIIKILTLAVEQRGTTFNDYVDGKGNKGSFLNFLKVYGRDGKPCRVCDTKIKKTKITGRGTRFCPQCQPLETQTSLI